MNNAVYQISGARTANSFCAPHGAGLRGPWKEGVHLSRSGAGRNRIHLAAADGGRFWVGVWGRETALRPARGLSPGAFLRHPDERPILRAGGYRCFPQCRALARPLWPPLRFDFPADLP